MTESQTDRWSAMESYPIDDPAATLTFSRRLQREQAGWSLDYTRRAVAEYRKFIFLAGLKRGQVTPSEDVDQVWHLHLVYTRDYRRFCECGGPFIHHGPTRGAQETGRFIEQYEATLGLYREYFGEPPGDLWPSSRERFKHAGAGRWIHPADFVVVPRRRLLALSLSAIALALLLTLWQTLL